MTFVITASSPDPVCCTLRVQPGDGTNESMLKPAGGENSICVVAASSFSVGTASVYSSSVLATPTAGLTLACANAVAGNDERGQCGEQEQLLHGDGSLFMA